MVLYIRFRDANNKYPDADEVPEFKAMKMEKQVGDPVVDWRGAVTYTSLILYASGGHLPWRRHFLEAFFIFCVTATVLVPTSHAESPSGKHHIPPLHFPRASSCVHLLSCTDLFHFPHRGVQLCAPFPNTCRWGVWSSSSEFLSGWSCLLCPFWFSGQLHPSHCASAGRNFSCHWCLSQQRLLTIISWLLCWSQE